LEVQSGYVFDNQEDEDEAVAAISAYRASGGCAVQLRHFMDGFWDLVPRKDTFKAYTLEEVQMFIGGVTKLRRFASAFFFRYPFSPNLGFDRDECQKNPEEESDKHLEWFWKVVDSWPTSTDHHKALLRYMTGLDRVPAFDTFKILKASDGNFRRVTVLGNNKRTVPDKEEDTPEHIFFIPEFDTREALGENLLHVIYNHDPVCVLIVFNFMG